MSIREMWANRILSVLMIAVLLYTFFGNRQNVVDDMTQAEIDSKPSKNYVDDQDADIIREMKEEDTEIRGEMKNMEVRFNKGDDRILEQMKADKLELIETIKMNKQ